MKNNFRRLNFNETFQAVVSDTRLALARAANCFYDFPSQKLTIAGITGTNGKTTTAFLTEAIFKAERVKTGLIGTVELRIADKAEKLTHTTPESLDLQQILARMVKSSVQKVAMEVSSHAIHQKRTEGISFDVLGFTNLSRDHLDYHQSFDEYREVKKSLFEKHPQVSKVVNIDDDLGAEIASTFEEVITCGLERPAFVMATDVEASPQRTSFKLKIGDTSIPVSLKLKGRFNVYNSLIAAGMAWALGSPIEKIKDGLESVVNVPGRMEFVDAGQDFLLVVDYAHTPDGLEKVLINCRDICSGRLIVVFGCGGDRDKGKRPLMGKVSARLSDFAIITSDNPRTEEPEDIINQIEEGFLSIRTNNYKKIIDRREAIGEAIDLARPGDLVLIAGKGHEDYQIFKDRTIHFSDREEAIKILTKGKERN